MDGTGDSPRQGNCQGRVWEVGWGVWEIEMPVLASASSSLERCIMVNLLECGPTGCCRPTVCCITSGILAQSHMLLLLGDVGSKQTCELQSQHVDSASG